MPIHFFDEDCGFKPENPEELANWIGRIINEFDMDIGELNYIFCSDEHLLNMNREYLDHDYFTDIITFDNSEDEQVLEGDIFMSIERIRENATNHEESFQNEFHRVVAHGVLHLIGFNDKTEDEQKVMTEKEDACLSLRDNKSFT